MKKEKNQLASSRIGKKVCLEILQCANSNLDIAELSFEIARKGFN